MSNSATITRRCTVCEITQAWPVEADRCPICASPVEMSRSAAQTAWEYRLVFPGAVPLPLNDEVFPTLEDALAERERKIGVAASDRNPIRQMQVQARQVTSWQDPPDGDETAGFLALLAEIVGEVRVFGGGIIDEADPDYEEAFRSALDEVLAAARKRLGASV